ncbi:kelch domain-containing protein 7A isoform X2 [Petaurus breviceps papuanus]|uniref:kelch domain-containing protein 7A isoform X2 n=1 Tax=Petaurus breviceps papuanus TaxID=3040969 RepID=UPI0036DC15C5
MSDSGSEPWDWHLDMQFTGKLVFSAAALLLGTLVYRLYKYWPSRDPPTGGTLKADATATEEPEVAGQADPTSTSPRALLPGLSRQRQVSREEGAKGNPALGNGQPEGAGGACDPKVRGRLDLGDGHTEENEETGFKRGEQHPGKLLVWDSLGEKAIGQGFSHLADGTKDVCESVPSSESPSSPLGPGLSRKESFLQIAENPDFQLQLDNMGTSLSSDVPLALHSSIESVDLNPTSASLEPKVELVAGTNFFQLPLVPGASQNTHLDLGNCYEVLNLAKREKLDALKEAAYKVMSDNYLQVLQSPDIYGHLSGAERELILQRRLQGQKYLVVADVCPQEGSGRLCAYSNERDTWWPLASLPPEAISRGCAFCSLFNYLFVVAGCQRAGGQASKRVFCYNPLTGIWREMRPLNQARPHCKLVVLDGYMYAIGGECLYTVERYDPRQDRWSFVAPLPNDTFALAHTATACDGDIYVTGGTLRYLLLRYSGKEDRWRASPTAGGKDRTAEMVAVNGFLYRFDLNRSLGIGVYRCSTRARLWYECSSYRMPYPAAFQCAVVDNLIHCVGRQFHLRFLADYVSPRFLSNGLQGFPSPQGTLIPTVLALPTPNLAQTRV